MPHMPPVRRSCMAGAIALVALVVGPLTMPSAFASTRDTATGHAFGIEATGPKHLVPTPQVVLPPDGSAQTWPSSHFGSRRARFRVGPLVPQLGQPNFGTSERSCEELHVDDRRSPPQSERATGLQVGAASFNLRRLKTRVRQRSDQRSRTLIVDGNPLGDPERAELVDSPR